VLISGKKTEKKERTKLKASVQVQLQPKHNQSRRKFLNQES
jgi:hypothetical protein